MAYNVIMEHDLMMWRFLCFLNFDITSILLYLLLERVKVYLLLGSSHTVISVTLSENLSLSEILTAVLVCHVIVS